ncbi:MAG: hypothetical protein AAF944_19905 [Bacteroidota bacterium]
MALLLLLIAYAASLTAMFYLVRKEFRTYGSRVAAAAVAAPVAKKFKVKITGNSGEKLIFSSLPEEDIKQIIETIVALQQEKKNG